VAEPPVTLAALLRRLRTGARLMQEELAEAADLSPRSISDLERGINLTARKDTARLLADALGLAGPARAAFEAVARGRPVPGGVVPGGDGTGSAGTGGAVPGGAAAATRTLPRDIAPAWTTPPPPASTPGHRADRRPGRAAAARRPVGRGHHPAHRRDPGRPAAR